MWRRSTQRRDTGVPRLRKCGSREGERALAVVGLRRQFWLRRGGIVEARGRGRGLGDSVEIA